jgi:DNA polymerase-3 subunit gamma/tau
VEACGVCNTCQSFKNNTSFNVFELDAASNNSVDDIRNLTDQVRFAPQSGKYKIYIIDEVHMLSAAAFNAFLKTLEEPPPYAIFILATTEKHKILPTILSRCQIFDFKRITTHDITSHLHGIATKEGVIAQEAALHVIAQKSEGCMRDALSMLDRIVSFTNGMLTYSSTMEHLNLLDADYYFKLTDHILSQDVSSTLLQLDNALERGFEGDVILLLCKDPRMAKLLDVPNDHKPVFHEKANQAPPSFIISALNVVNESELNYKNATNKRLHIEMCFIRLCYLLQATSATADDVKKNTSNVGFQPPAPVQSPVMAAPPVPQPQPLQAAPFAAPTYAPPPVNAPAPPPDAVVPQPQATSPVPQPSRPELPKYEPKTPVTSDGAPVKHRISKNLMDLDAALADIDNIAEQEKAELTDEMVARIWDEHKEMVHGQNKSMLYAQLLQMKLEVLPPDEIRIICPTDLTNTYAMDYRNTLIDYFRKASGVMIRITTKIVEDSAIAAQQQTTVLSKQEIFDAMVQKNPHLGSLKDALNLQVEY